MSSIDKSKPNYSQTLVEASRCAFPLAWLLLFIQPSYTLILSAAGSVEAESISHGLPWVWLQDGANSLSLRLALQPLVLNVIVLSLLSFPIALWLNTKFSAKYLANALYLLSFLIGAAYYTLYLSAEVTVLENFDFKGYELERRHYSWPAHIG